MANGATKRERRPEEIEMTATSIKKAVRIRIATAIVPGAAGRAAAVATLPSAAHTSTGTPWDLGTPWDNQ
jgi:hypothetical protein